MRVILVGTQPDVTLPVNLTGVALPYQSALPVNIVSVTNPLPVDALAGRNALPVVVVDQ